MIYNSLEAGVDEAGCGSLIGDLVAAAVILRSDLNVDDSKKLSSTRREKLYAEIIANADVGVGRISLEELNGNSFSWARRTVFQRALQSLTTTPKTIVVDGMHFFDGFRDIPFECIPKADAKYKSVAAASIVAKVVRDRSILEHCGKCKEVADLYGWTTNMGYPTKVHLDALKTHGVTTFHRCQFGPCRTE